jgi:membrane glycosyltransferase
MTFRRLLFGGLVVATMALLLWLAAMALARDGLDALEIAVLALFVIVMPWMVIGFWNALIGFLIMRFSADLVAAVFPATALVRPDAPISSRTAVLICIRNEPPQRTLRNLAPLVAGLAADAAAGQFQIFVLSDTDLPDIAAEEGRVFAHLAEIWRDRVAITYRRRSDNIGFKAGNIRDFCERWGHDFEFAITLDADSVMPAAAVLRLVRVMQVDPKLGIVQALVVGMPATSAFARIFQFGMRFGMRSYTLGSAWWQGDCGPYWGHNAVLRLKPFIDACELPPLPDGTHILSHDQIEAVLMRRAGYDVRVLPEEDLGWEENPPSLIEFLRRDLRWCQGNMQYWRFLAMPGLRPVSRCQLAIAILMFVGSLAWVGLLVLVTVLAARGPGRVIDTHYGWLLLFVILFMWFAPKVATVIDVLLQPALRRAYGGTARMIASVFVEVVFFILLSPIQWISHTLHLMKLALGRGTGWGAQSRDDHTVPLSHATQWLWPHTLLGVASIGALLFRNAAAIPVMLLVAGGPLLAIPFAVFTARRAVGNLLIRLGLCALPEENAPPKILRDLDVPAIVLRGHA